MQVTTIDSEIDGLMLTIPNIPNESVPQEILMQDNLEIRKWGTATEYLILNQKLIGILEKILIYWILVKLQRLPGKIYFL